MTQFTETETTKTEFGVSCPACGGSVSRHGRVAGEGDQRYRCRGCGKTFTEQKMPGQRFTKMGLDAMRDEKQAAGVEHTAPVRIIAGAAPANPIGAEARQ